MSRELCWETLCSRCAFSRLWRAVQKWFWVAGLRVKSAEAILRSFWIGYSSPQMQMMQSLLKRWTSPVSMGFLRAAVLRRMVGNLGIEGQNWPWQFGEFGGHCGAKARETFGAIMVQ